MGGVGHMVEVATNPCVLAACARCRPLPQQALSAPPARCRCKNRGICNCASPIAALGRLLLRDCSGPFCAILRRMNAPKKPIFDMALPSFDLSRLGVLLRCGADWPWSCLHGLPGG